jgi:hypothetical protein
MYARIQTWFPFNIQVGLNGREWLARQMDQERLKYRQQGNCFVWIEDYAQAQKLLDRQLETKWAELLNGFGGQLNPLHESIFAKYRSIITGPVTSRSGPRTWYSPRQTF